MICPKCESNMQIKTNNATKKKFLGCSNYPNCNHTSPYIDPSENQKNIQSIINKYEADIRTKLEIPSDVKVKYEFRGDMKDSATCRPISDVEFIIKWNVDLNRSTLVRILIDLAHEYRHVYQHYYDTFDEEYDITKKWRTRPQEEDAINFSYEYIDNIILNYKL